MMKFLIFIIVIIGFINSQFITTIAGTGTAGYNSDNILATDSELNHPFAIFIDNYGNMFISDAANNRIRKVNNITKIITTVVGNGLGGYNGDNILASSASLYLPYAIFVDLNGNLYIADIQNNRVRFVNASTQIITTIAGNGVQGYNGDNILAINSHINGVFAIIVDNNGNIFISDIGNNRIRKIDNVTKIITTIAGNGNYQYNGDNIFADMAGLTPGGMYFDLNGNLYISDCLNNRIRFINMSTYIITTIAGTGIEGYNGDNILAINSELNYPCSLFVDLYGNIFISDYQNTRVRKINNITKIITTIAGNGTVGYNGDNIPAIDATLSGQSSLFMDNNQNLYIVDILNNRIRMIYNINTPITNNSNNISTLLMEILIPISFVLIVSAIIIFVIYYKKRKQSKIEVDLPETPTELIEHQYIENNIKNNIENNSIKTIDPASKLSKLSNPSNPSNKLIIDKNALIIKNVSIQEQLGEGTFGLVSKGLWNNTKVALKQLKDLSKIDEFLKEAKILQELMHPNIIQYFGIYYDGENPLLVMEFMYRGNLLHLLKSKKDSLSLNLNHLKKIVQDTLNGMTYLESKNVIHCDLAARNLLVSKIENDYIVKISDFGLGKIMEQDKQYYIINGNIPVKWTAPEVFDLMKYTIKSDVWAFGVVLWEIYTFGEEPYSELRTTFKIIEKIQQGYTLKPSENTPDEIKLIMKKCFERDHKKRPSFLEINQDNFFKENTENKQIESEPKQELQIDIIYGKSNL
jgi:sugar lactone lactonase YvrE/predicted Ser/Thr protein kinase